MENQVSLDSKSLNLIKTQQTCRLGNSVKKTHKNSLKISFSEMLLQELTLYEKILKMSFH